VIRDGEADAPDVSRRSEAAARLRHDLGKAVRFSAPERPEVSVEEMRVRLGRDVLETRSSPDGRRTAVEVFDRWRAEEGAAFPDSGPLREGLDRIGAAVEVLRRLGPRLAVLGPEELRRLDAATIAIAKECRALAREAAKT